MLHNLTVKEKGLVFIFLKKKSNLIKRKYGSRILETEFCAFGITIVSGLIRVCEKDLAQHGYENMQNFPKRY